jgi:hypothetical protein
MEVSDQLHALAAIPPGIRWWTAELVWTLKRIEKIGYKIGERSFIHLLGGLWKKWQISGMMNGVSQMSGHKAICSVLRYRPRLRNIPELRYTLKNTAKTFWKVRRLRPWGTELDVRS